MATPRDEVARNATLPDLLCPGLAIVFVGINPSLYSVERGHYFARGTNRFWPAFSRSRLSAAARRALGAATLGPANDIDLPAHGFGFTDVVKRATVKASELRPGELEAAAPELLGKLARLTPRIACFHGVTGFRPFHLVVFPRARHKPTLGLQTERIGETQLFVVPSPSGANAHASLAGQVAWYDRLAELLYHE